MNNLKTHIFNGKRYKIEFKSPSKLPNDYGKCDAPNKKGKRIVFNRDLKNLKDLEQLELYLHEGFHANFYWLDEHDVTKAAQSMAKFLYRLGYRKHK